MGVFKQAMGLDFVDVTIHVVTTGFLTILADAAAQGNADGFIALICATSSVALGVRRHFALKKQAQYPESTGEVAALRVEDLEARVADLEHGQMRMQELEERLDFAERMLTQQREVRQLASREDP